jgi:hypothetical protein
MSRNDPSTKDDYGRDAQQRWPDADHVGVIGGERES